MPTGYEPLPSYPPPSSGGPPYPLKQPASRLQAPSILKYILGLVVGLVVIHYALIGALPSSTYAGRFRRPDAGSAYAAAVNLGDKVLEQLDPDAGQPGTFFRDGFVLRTALAFWELAEQEVRAKGLDTCNDQLGKSLVEAYHTSVVDYCAPRSDGGSSITCLPVHRSPFSKWWPYPAAPCLSTNLLAKQDDQRRFVAVGCDITDDGRDLLREMGSERFLGTDLDQAVEGSCQENINRTLVVIGRQDQWNPFHVAEDLITTMVTLFIAARTDPSLVNDRVQLVFSEGFSMDANHFTPLWDRMGAWAPRRLALDPWGEGVCLSRAIHSVGAGASLLSAMGVGVPYACASTITWAAAHYYRHLFGLLPPSLNASRRPINVIWLSRAKLDNYAQKHNDWSVWRDIRHIRNEKQLVERLRHGLRELCEEEHCQFEDVQDVPEHWGLDTVEDGPLPVRFAMLDPTVHALETQIHFVGHGTILLSSHGGALGLSLFLPPGNAAVIELQVDRVTGNFHFQHMAKEMGHKYELLQIEQDVNVEQVWQSLQRSVLHLIQ